MKMSMHWQELLPADQYRVSTSGLLHDYDRKIVTRLYQPLIGPICFSLFMTFWSELEENRLWSEPNTHYSLMNTLGLNLSEIYQARLKLEGIGLLNVYKKEIDEVKEFVYEINPPLSPLQFFTDGMLNIYLFKKIGKAQYNRLKRFFSDDLLPVQDYDNVTKTFAEIFASDHSLYVSDEAKGEEMPLHDQRFIGRQEGTELTGFESYFDFDLLMAGVKSSLVPKKAFTPKIKSTIAKLAFLYGIDPLEMQKLVIGATFDDEIDEEYLRKSARDWYQIEKQSDMPSLIYNVQPPKYRTQAGKPKTQEEEYIHYLETTSPLEVMKHNHNGGEVVEADLTIIENVMINQNLYPGVVNVLIEYVMMKAEKKFTKNYVEKIAGHWSRMKIVTVKDAMELARNEHRKYQTWVESNKNHTKDRRRKIIRTEMVPEWMNKKETTNEQPEKTEEAPTISEERKRAIWEQVNKLNAGGDSLDEKD